MRAFTLSALAPTGLRAFDPDSRRLAQLAIPYTRDDSLDVVPALRSLDEITYHSIVETENLVRRPWPRPHRVRFDGPLCGRFGWGTHAGRGNQHQQNL